MARSDSNTSGPVVKGDGNKTAAVVFHKTRMCRFHVVGKCTRGNACLFAHSPTTLRARPDFTCTRVCPRLIEDGYCNDFHCKFAHNKEQLRHRKPTEVELEARVVTKKFSSCEKGRQTDKITEVKKQQPIGAAGWSMPVDTTKADEDGEELERATCSGSWQTSWSRQTTDDSNRRNGGVSPHFSEESSSWPDLELQRAESEVSASEATSSTGLCRPRFLPSELSYKVKNTFLEFSAVDGDVPQASATRRATSVPRSLV